MLRLENTGLTVELLDPATDQTRLGARYVWGGYIWQVHDRRAGPLLTGAQWPEAEPDPYNGQGLPESFRHRTITGEPLLWNGDTGLSPGAGRLGKIGDAVVVTVPCGWEISAHDDHVILKTAQTVGSWSYELVRTVELRGRQLCSRTRYTNRSASRLVHEWFVHPFFALGKDGRAEALLPRGTSLPPNPGYVIEANRLSFKRGFEGKFDGHLDYLQLPPHTAFSAELNHPRLAHVRFTSSFVPIRTVIWANGNTLSLEPYLTLDLAPGETKEWSLTYEFGEPLGA